MAHTDIPSAVKVLAPLSNKYCSSFSLLMPKEHEGPKEFSVFTLEVSQVRQEKHIGELNDCLVNRDKPSDDLISSVSDMYRDSIDGLIEATILLHRRRMLIVFEGVIADSLTREHGNILDIFSGSYRRAVSRWASIVGAQQARDENHGVEMLYSSTDAGVFYV